MDAELSLQIIRPLSEGVHPVTGEELPGEDTCQHPRVIRALMGAVLALEEMRDRETRGRRRPVRAGRPWSQEDDARLAEDFDKGMSMAELATLHERSRGAIVARLERLGKRSG